jgi:hypothetical protein
MVLSVLFPGDKFPLFVGPAPGIRITLIVRPAVIFPQWHIQVSSVSTLVPFFDSFEVLIRPATQVAIPVIDTWFTPICPFIAMADLRFTPALVGIVRIDAEAKTAAGDIVVEIVTISGLAVVVVSARWIVRRRIAI